MKKEDPEIRFWRKATVSADGCWQWGGHVNHNGYGVFCPGRDFDNKSWLAHRFSWRLTRGIIPSGLNVLHRCDNPPCVNPDHLFLGTQQDNVRDCIKKNRFKSNAGENNTSAKLTSDMVRQIRNIWSKTGTDQKVIAGLFGISHAAVNKVITRFTWSHVE